MDLLMEDKGLAAPVENPLKLVLVRYNTRQDNDNPLPWRVLTASQFNPELREEIFVEKVVCEVPTTTTQNEIAEGIIKWHISAEGYTSLKDQVFYITPLPV